MSQRLILPLAAAVLAATPLSAQPAAPTQAELTARLGSWLDSLAAQDRFSGVVVLARGGQPVFEHAYGLADRERGIPNTPATRFNLGSINKAFTATAIRQLAAAGRIQLDSSLAYHWPDYPNPAVARAVTVRQLLQHASGIGGDIFAAPAGGTRHQLRHNRDLLALFAAAPLQFTPGTQRRYSNAGYVVLGALVERVSGQDYYDYVREHVYAPAGMVETAHTPVDSLPAGTALGYTRRGEDGSPGEGAPRPNRALLPGRGSAAGGGYSTAADLLRYLAALRDGRIPQGGPAGIGVAGGAPGLNAVVEGDLPGGYDLVVMANLDPPGAELVAERVRGWLGAEPDQAGPARRRGP